MFLLRRTAALASTGVEDIVGRAAETLAGYYELGNQVVATPLARFVTNPVFPLIYDANHCGVVRGGSDPDEVDVLLQEVETVFGGYAHRAFKLDPLVPPAVEARLALEGYDAGAELQMLLEGDLRAPPPSVDVRPVESDADWESFTLLQRTDHEEVNRKEGRERFPAHVSEQMMGTKRAKCPDVAYFLARLDGVDCGFFSSWPGVDGLGKVEDLFTHPDHRRRGVASALIVRAVTDARERGARGILIGADPDDTPMHMYAALGFRPLFLFRTRTLTLPTQR